MMLSLGYSEADSEIGNQQDFLGSIHRKPVVEEWGGEGRKPKENIQTPFNLICFSIFL